jgi:ribosomal protein L18E
MMSRNARPANTQRGNALVCRVIDRLSSISRNQFTLKLSKISQYASHPEGKKITLFTLTALIAKSIMSSEG